MVELVIQMYDCWDQNKGKQEKILSVSLDKVVQEVYKLKWEIQWDDN